MLLPFKYSQLNNDINIENLDADNSLLQAKKKFLNNAVINFNKINSDENCNDLINKNKKGKLLCD